MIGLITAIVESDYDDKAFLLDLYNNYYRLTRKTIFYITHENQDIDDLINDCFIKLIDKISLIRTLDSYKLTAYIVYTARNVAINYIKRKRLENRYMYYSDDNELAEELSDNNLNSPVKRRIYYIQVYT